MTKDEGYAREIIAHIVFYKFLMFTSHVGNNFASAYSMYQYVGMMAKQISTYDRKAVLMKTGSYVASIL